MVWGCVHLRLPLHGLTAQTAAVLGEWGVLNMAAGHVCYPAPAPQMAADPDYDLPASMGSRPALRGSARPKPPSTEQLRAELEAQKQTLMWRYKLVG